MATVLEVHGDTDYESLRQLSKDLDDVLSSIAYDGKSADVGWIQKKQTAIRRTYSELVERCIHIGSEEGLPFAIYCIITAYSGLHDLFISSKTPEELEAETRELVNEYLIHQYPDET